MRKKLSVIFSIGIMVLMLAACGSSNNSTPSSSDVPNVKEETSTTGQIENSDNADSSVDSSVDSTSTPEPTPTEEPSSTPTQEPTETPTPEPTETPTPTPEPTPTETPTPTPELTPTETPTPTPEPTVPPVEDDDPTPSTPSEWNGDYDTLPSDGFDHIKVPTIDDFYDEGLDNNDGAFDFGNRPEWEEEWYDAYNEFLVANGSPIIDDTPIGAFYAINPGSTFINGKTYQYLYYGYRGDATNGWGDIVLYNSSMHPQSSGTTNYNDAYFLETSNFFYGEMDKGLEDEYRAAITMMLSWIVPNPQEVEKAIYDFHVDKGGDDYEATLTTLVKQHGYGSWVQIGEVDVSVVLLDSSSQSIIFAFRQHK